MLGTRARDAFNRGTLPADTAFTRIQGLWDPLRLDATDRLAHGNQVFATFEHPAGAPRDDATAMSQALALPLWQAPRSGLELLIELAYATDTVGGYRFPTVADAGWIHLFQPSSEDAPDSWPGNPARPAWEALLTRPESATHALSALGTSLEQQASHLTKWWRACPPEERELELRQLVFEALTTEGEPTARDILGRVSGLPADLRHAIDRELQTNGARPLAPRERRSSSGLNSLKEAGFRREHLLRAA